MIASGTQYFYPNSHGPGHAAALPPSALGPGGADVWTARMWRAHAQAWPKAARQYEPRPRSSAVGDVGEYLNIRFAERSEGKGNGEHTTRTSEARTGKYA